MLNILVLNDTIKSKNFGCQLVSHSLRKTLNEVYPGSVITYAPFNSNHNPKLGYDLVIVNGEGSFGHHNQIPHGFQSNGPAMRWYMDRGVDVYLVNLSIQCDLGVLKAHEEFLSKCKLITLREPISYLFLLKNTSLTNIKLYPDLGTNYFEEENVQKDLDFCFGFGALSKEYESIKPQTDAYFKALNTIREEGYSATYLGFPGNPSSDGELADGRLIDIVVEEGTFEQYYHTVKRAKVNLTGRHHGAVMSFLGKTPFMSFNSNMWKTEGDQILYGPYDYFNFRHLNTGQLVDYLKSSYINYNKQAAFLDKRYEDLAPMFDAHIRCTKEDVKDVIERGILTPEYISRCVQELSYIDLNRYGLSEKI